MISGSLGAREARLAWKEAVRRRRRWADFAWWYHCAKDRARSARLARIGEALRCCFVGPAVSCHGETYGLVWTFQNAFTPQLPMFIKARHAKYEGQQCSGHVCSHPLTGGGPCQASRLGPRDRFWVDFCPYGQSIRGVWTCMHFCILCTEAYSLC